MIMERGYARKVVLGRGREVTGGCGRGWAQIRWTDDRPGKITSGGEGVAGGEAGKKGNGAGRNEEGGYAGTAGLWIRK